MPFAEINLIPSVNTETSFADNPSGAQQSNFVRWRAALPEKRGGCTLYINQPLDGAPMALKPWGDFQGNSFLAIATPAEIYKYTKATDTLKVITPEYSDSLLASPLFSTTTGSQYVAIVDATAPTLTAFDAVQFNTPVSVGGLILIGTYPIQSSAGGGSYTIDAGYQATSTTSSVTGDLPVFETIAGSSQVIVTFPIQYQFDSLAVGDRIGFTVETTVGGIPIVGSYIVFEVFGATQFAFQAQYTATSSTTPPGVTMNGGFVSLRYWITEPPDVPPP